MKPSRFTSRPTPRWDKVNRTASQEAFFPHFRAARKVAATAAVSLGSTTRSTTTAGTRKPASRGSSTRSGPPDDHQCHELAAAADFDEFVASGPLTGVAPFACRRRNERVTGPVGSGAAPKPRPSRLRPGVSRRCGSANPGNRSGDSRHRPGSVPRPPSHLQPRRPRASARGLQQPSATHVGATPTRDVPHRSLVTLVWDESR